MSFTAIMLAFVAGFSNLSLCILRYVFELSLPQITSHVPPEVYILSSSLRVGLRWSISDPPTPAYDRLIRLGSTQAFLHTQDELRTSALDNWNIKASTEV
jgi:hypothetical protein